MVRVFVVADHDVAREGLASVLDAETDFAVVAESEHVPDLLEALADRSPEVVVVDHSPPHGDGMRLCRALREAAIDVRVVLLVDVPNTDSVEQALRAGAQVCLAKDAHSDRLIAAVRDAASGAPAAPPGPTSGTEGVPILGRSQLAVLRLLVEGKSVRQIAEATGLSQHTVRSYLRHIYRRLGASSRGEAAAVALRHHLL